MSAVLKPVEYTELLIGCGSRRQKLIAFKDTPEEFQNLTTLDIFMSHEPDLVWDLEMLPLPFDDNSFNEIHAYEVLEHTGRQGDWRFFFKQFADFWRILKPDGLFCASTPMWDSEWAWGDPGHSRIISPKTLMFLEQPFYKSVGKDASSDYREVYRADFRVVAMQEKDSQFFWVMQAKK